jgi:hypothetical protein
MCGCPASSPAPCQHGCCVHDPRMLQKLPQLRTATLRLKILRPQQSESQKGKNWLKKPSSQKLTRPYPCLRIPALQGSWKIPKPRNYHRTGWRLLAICLPTWKQRSVAACACGGTGARVNPKVPLEPAGPVRGVMSIRRETDLWRSVPIFACRASQFLFRSDL